MTLGRRIKELRNSKNLTQEELAQKLDANRPTLSNWELDRTQPGYTMLKKVAEFFEVSTDYLLNGTLNIDELLPGGKLLVYSKKDEIIDISDLSDKDKLIIINIINMAKNQNLNKK